MSNNINTPSMLPMIPTIPMGDEGFRGIVPRFGTVVPYEFTGWKKEVMSWTTTAYLGAAISQSTVYIVKGPQVQDFMKKYFVNNFDKFPVGRAKHGIMCNKNGKIMADGVILRTAEDEYWTYWLWPYVQYCAETCSLEVQGEVATNRLFLYQVGGPNSLQVVEKACGESLHDIEFLHFRNSEIAGCKVRILRLGMAGTLAYEIHGDLCDAHVVYKALWEAGKDEYGLTKLGYQAYMLNHTENGYPQAVYHFYYAYLEDPDFLAWLSANPALAFYAYPPMLHGSAADDYDSVNRNPIECNWGGMIDWSHDFIGREALLAIKENPKRKTVTLEWNAEDIGDIFASQFRDDVPYDDIDRPNDYLNFDIASNGMHQLVSKVVVDGKVIGVSSGRARAERYHRMISQACIDLEYAEEGTEVTVIWGEVNSRQKAVRATVARFPYLTAERNKYIDVSSIPHGNK